MVTQKHSKKRTEPGNQDSDDRTKVFGVDLKTIGGAIATAVVTEIAQTALSKAAHAQQNGDQANHNSVMGRTADVASSVGESLEEAATTTGDRLKSTVSVAEEKLGDWNSSLGTGTVAKLAQEILEALQPVLLKLIEAVIESAGMAYRSATEAVEVGQDAATDAIETVAQARDSAPQGFQSNANDILQSVQNGVAGAATTAKNVLEEIQPIGSKDSQKKKKKKKKKSKK